MKWYVTPLLIGIFTWAGASTVSAQYRPPAAGYYYGQPRGGVLRNLLRAGTRFGLGVASDAIHHGIYHYDYGDYLDDRRDYMEDRWNDYQDYLQDRRDDYEDYLEDRRDWFEDHPGAYPGYFPYGPPYRR